MLLRLHHAQLTIPKGQEGLARDFYCSLLGMREVEKPATLKANGGLWLQLGDIQVHLGIQDAFDRATSKSHLAFLVSDLEAMRERLREKGIEPKAGSLIPGYARFEFRDPFGNRLEML